MQIGIHLEQQIQSADPLHLICLYYRNAIGAIRQARQCLVEGRTAERTTYISLTHGIVSELYRTLDRTAGDGSLASGLDRLYEYMMRRLIVAHTSQKDEPLAEVSSLLCSLQESWERLAAQQSSPRSSQEALIAGMPFAALEVETPACSYSF